jgi:hypothetical protein
MTRRWCRGLAGEFCIFGARGGQGRAIRGGPPFSKILLNIMDDWVTRLKCLETPGSGVGLRDNVQATWVVNNFME